MQPSPFSAIIPHHNRPEILYRSLEKLRSAWGAGLHEILVVDDGSDTDQIPSPDRLGRNVTLLRHECARGPAACRNRAARCASGELLLFLDDDSWPLSGQIETVAGWFERSPNLGAVGCRVRLGDQCESGGAFNAFVGCGAFVRKQAFTQAGGFPESFAFYAEEYGLCYELVAAGFDVCMYEEPTVFHAKSLQYRDQATILSQLVRNNRLLLAPHAENLPDAARRLSEILDWYDLLGRFCGVQDAVREAAEQPLATRQSEPMNETTWTRVSGADLLESFSVTLYEQGLRRVSLWPVGKDSARFQRALEQNGIRVLGIFDPANRFRIDDYAGLSVRQTLSRESDAVVVASMSPGLCWNGLFGSVLTSAPVVHAGFGYLPVREPPSRRLRHQYRN